MLIKLNKDNVWFKGSNLSREPVSVCDAVAIVTWAKVWILTIFIHSGSIKWENMGRNKAFASSSSPFPAWVPDLALPSNLVSSHCIMGVMLYLFLKKYIYVAICVYAHAHQGMSEEVRGQSFLLYILEHKLRCQSWWQVSLPSESSCQLTWHCFLFFLLFPVSLVVRI